MKVFDHPFTAMISDSSGLGKTSFVSKILKKKLTVTSNFMEIVNHGLILIEKEKKVSVFCESSF